MSSFILRWSRIIIAGLIGIVVCSNTTFATMPFTDVSIHDPYYTAVSRLFEAKIITDDGSGLFLPNNPMNRDFFVSLTTEIGCKSCMTPEYQDIVRFQTPPFVDITQEHPYYYCISYAKEDRITQGYLLNLSGTMTCEDGNTYTSNPFCANNSITRIEAVAMLLRRANLWNDTLNSQNFSHQETITDVSTYWYGYAQKAIQSGLITKYPDNTIRGEEKITRGEFAMMASRILEFTQCEKDHSDFTIASRIDVYDENNTPASQTTFQESEVFTLIPYTESGSWNYTWEALHTDGDTISASGNIFPGNTLSLGQWGITMTVLDGNKPVSNAHITLVIIPDDANNTHYGLGVSLTGQPQIAGINSEITFIPHVQSGTQNIQYQWDFGDGFRRSDPGVQTHKYTHPGIYRVTLTIRDSLIQKTAQASVIIRITGSHDGDGDSVGDDEDACPEITGSPENHGCPIVRIPDYECIIGNAYGGNSPCNYDSDGDGVSDHEDQCPYIPGPISNLGCPIDNPDNNDPDGDGIPIPEDQCPSLPGVPEYEGCPPPINPITRIQRNTCILDMLKSQGLLIGSASCDSCPCLSMIDISSRIRVCDVIFPSILSPDQQMIYSRGPFFLIP